MWLAHYEKMWLWTRIEKSSLLPSRVSTREERKIYEFVGDQLNWRLQMHKSLQQIQKLSKAQVHRDLLLSPKRTRPSGWSWGKASVHNSLRQKAQLWQAPVHWFVSSGLLQAVSVGQCKTSFLSLQYCKIRTACQVWSAFAYLWWSMQANSELWSSLWDEMPQWQLCTLSFYGIKIV